MTDRLHLEDLSVGLRLLSDTHTLDGAQVAAFAAEYDPQPFHLDEAAARESMFGSIAASGWHTAAITMRLLVTSGLPLAGGLIGAGGELVWPRPTYPGDVLRVEAEVTDIKPSATRPDRGMITVRVVTRNQRDEDVQIMTARILAFRRPSQDRGSNS